MVLPILQNYQQQAISGVLNSVVNLYGVRLSYEKKEVDNDAVLVLEDLIDIGK